MTLHSSECGAQVHTCWQCEQTFAATVGDATAGRLARRSAAAAALHGLQYEHSPSGAACRCEN